MTTCAPVQPVQTRVCQSCEHALAVIFQTFDDLVTFEVCGACYTDATLAELVQR